MAKHNSFSTACSGPLLLIDNRIVGQTLTLKSGFVRLRDDNAVPNLLSDLLFEKNQFQIHGSVKTTAFLCKSSDLDVPDLRKLYPATLLTEIAWRVDVSPP